MTDKELRGHRCPRDQRRALVDARGIFCCYVCDACYEAKRARYRPDIFTDPNYWTDEPVEPEEPEGDYASREEQRARYLECGPQAWDDRDPDEPEDPDIDW